MAGRGAGREKYWRGVMTRQAKSGLSVAKFCKRESVSEQSYYYWKRKLREHGVQGRRKVPARNNRAGVAQATVNPSPQFVPVQIEHERPSRAIRIQWPSGVCVEVACGVNPQEVAGVLQALHQLAPLPTEET